MSNLSISGMSLRDYFAAQAMQGLCVNTGRNSYSFSDVEKIAEVSYQIADAMISEKQKTESKK